MQEINTESQLNELLGIPNKLYILDFNAGWCAPCRAMSNITNNLNKDELAGAEILSINIDNMIELSQEYNIRSIPTYLFVKDNMIIDRIKGQVNKITFLEKIEKNVSK